MSLSGVLIVDKPTGVTSHDVILRLRRLLGVRAIGHAGTLDPGAGGVLLACLGRATKIVRFLSECDKEYEAVIRLGVTTDTYDADGKITGVKDDLKMSPEQIREAVLSFKGKISQMPPLYSAVKYRGKKLYQYARAQEKVEVKRRKVEIKEIQIEKIDLPHVRIRVSCSKGTYVRSLASDIGEKLACGAHLFGLRRTAVGPFGLRDALDLEQIETMHRHGELRESLIPLERALSHLPSVMVKRESVQRVRQGIPLAPVSVASTEGDFAADESISIKDEDGNVVAVGKALGSARDFGNPQYRGKLFRYLRVM